MSGVVLSVSASPAAPTAVTSVERAGLLDAAVATGSSAMPPTLPAPSAGSDAQAGPNGSVIAAGLTAIDSGAIDSGAIDSGAMDAGAMDSGVIDAGAVVAPPLPDEQAANTNAALNSNPPMRAALVLFVIVVSPLILRPAHRPLAGRRDGERCEWGAAR